MEKKRGGGGAKISSRKKVEGLCCGTAAKKIGVQELFLSENRWCGVAAKKLGVEKQSGGHQQHPQVIKSNPQSQRLYINIGEVTSI